jgi:small subunit ribosomal protein S9
MAEAKASARKFYLGTGRRKTSVARVRLADGTGKIAINGRSLTEYFTEDKDRAAVVGPLQLAEMSTKLDLFVNVKGGGITGQAGAICQGIARALKTMFGLDTSGAAAPPPSEDGTAAGGGNFAQRLRESGFLTRDSRMKERKKYGRKGARKSFQFSKR